MPANEPKTFPIPAQFWREMDDDIETFMRMAFMGLTDEEVERIKEMNRNEPQPIHPPAEA